MSTRSHIMCEVGDDKNIISSYCHMDGYPTGVGKTLLFSYNDPLLAEDLVQVGYMSSCCNTIEEIKATRVNQDEYRMHNNIEDAMYSLDPLFIEYVYLWKDKSWWISSSNGIIKPYDAFDYGSYFHYYDKFKVLDTVINSEVA